VQISNQGGCEPQWRGDSRELFFASLDGPPKLMAVDLAERGDAIQAGIPHALLDLPVSPLRQRNRWLPTRDGKRFLAIPEPEVQLDSSFEVIVNWPSLLPKQ
jgi:hypothetical protein